MREPPEPYRTQILMQLVALAKAGRANGYAVWCSGGLPSIRETWASDVVTLSWQEAAEMAGVELPEDYMRKTIKAALERSKSTTRVKRVLPRRADKTWGGELLDWCKQAEVNRKQQGDDTPLERKKA